MGLHPKQGTCFEMKRRNRAGRRVLACQAGEAGNVSGYCDTVSGCIVPGHAGKPAGAAIGHSRPSTPLACSRSRLLRYFFMARVHRPASISTTAVVAPIDPARQWLAAPMLPGSACNHAVSRPTHWTEGGHNPHAARAMIREGEVSTRSSL